MARTQQEADASSSTMAMSKQLTSSQSRQRAWAGWLLLIIAFVFVLTLIANLACWYDFFDRSDVLYAQRFAEDPKDYYEAKLLSTGMAYVGTCGNCNGEGEENDNRCGEYHKCYMGEENEMMCREAQEEYVPLPAAFLEHDPEVGRRLYESDEHGFNPSKDKSCFDKYRAWALVEFTVDGGKDGTNSTFKRCAYLYGTRANSKQSGFYGDLVPPELTFHSSDLPESLWVWAQRREDRCVVGFHMKMEDFVQKEIIRDKLAIIGALVSCCGMCFFGCFCAVLSQVEGNQDAYRGLVLCQESGGSSVQRRVGEVTVLAILHIFLQSTSL